MADPLPASRIVSLLRAEGLRVVEHRNWRTHNRNHKGPWGPVHGVMVHHTVTSGTQRSVELCYNGHSTLPGPLCLGVIAKDGTVYLVGYGRANHAGLGDDDVLRAVIAERDTLPPPNENNTDGNARFYGFECENLGDGKDPWPAAQLDAIERASAAICRAHGWNERSVIGHLEWTNSKVDPRGFSMHTMRDRIGTRLELGSNAAPVLAPTIVTSELAMSTPAYLSLGFTKHLPLPPGEWTPLVWEHEHGDPLNEHPDGGQEFIVGKGRYTGDIYLRGQDLTNGQELQVRLVEEDTNGAIVARHPIVEILGTDGGSFGAVPITGYVGEGRKVKAHVVNWDDHPVTLTAGYLKALVWNS